MKTSRKVRTGFTVMELMSVIAIIGVLAAILLPALARAREAARRTSCMSNLAQIGMAMQMYARENQGSLPWSGGGNNADFLYAFRVAYVGLDAVFVCPSDPKTEFRNGQEAFDNVELNLEGSYRVSYDFMGAYTLAPLQMPPPQYGIPPVPIAWDFYSGLTNERLEAERSRYVEAEKTAKGDAGGFGGLSSNPYVDYEAYSPNHVPGIGNVLWMDGHVSAMASPQWHNSNVPALPDRVELGEEILNPTLLNLLPSDERIKSILEDRVAVDPFPSSGRQF
ncbi:MAG: hypothetical protein AMXMBFR84_24420 [Candidatus Hydrogenedentota bacterium]